MRTVPSGRQGGHGMAELAARILAPVAAPRSIWLGCGGTLLSRMLFCYHSRLVWACVYRS